MGINEILRKVYSKDSSSNNVNPQLRDRRMPEEIELEGYSRADYRDNIRARVLKERAKRSMVGYFKNKALERNGVPQGDKFFKKGIGSYGVWANQDPPLENTQYSDQEAEAIVYNKDPQVAKIIEKQQKQIERLKANKTSKAFHSSSKKRKGVRISNYNNKLKLLGALKKESQDKQKFKEAYSKLSKFQKYDYLKKKIEEQGARGFKNIAKDFKVKVKGLDKRLSSTLVSPSLIKAANQPQRPTSEFQDQLVNDIFQETGLFFNNQSPQSGERQVINSNLFFTSSPLAKENNKKGIEIINNPFWS